MAVKSVGFGPHGQAHSVPCTATKSLCDSRPLLTPLCLAFLVGRGGRSDPEPKALRTVPTHSKCSVYHSSSVSSGGVLLRVWGKQGSQEDEA